MSKQIISSPSSPMNSCDIPYANTTKCNAFCSTPLSFDAMGTTTPVCEFSRERYDDSISRDKASCAYNISHDILYGPHTSNSATEMTNLQFQMNSCIEFTDRNKIADADTLEDDDISSIGSISEDEDTMYLCFPTQQYCRQISTCIDEEVKVTPINCRQKFLGSVKKYKSTLQPSHPNIVYNNSGLISLSSETSDFRLLPKVNSRKDTEVIRSPFNPSEIPRSARKRSFIFTMRS